MTSQNQHVVPRGDKWAVLRAGATRVSASFPTQKEAIARARDLARQAGAVLYIHGQDGRIRERSSFVPARPAHS